MTFSPGTKCTYLLRLSPKGGEAGWSRGRILLQLVNAGLCYDSVPWCAGDQVSHVQGRWVPSPAPPRPSLNSAQKPVVKIKNKEGKKAPVSSVVGKAMFRKK